MKKKGNKSNSPKLTKRRGRGGALPVAQAVPAVPVRQAAPVAKPIPFLSEDCGWCIARFFLLIAIIYVGLLTISLAFAPWHPGMLYFLLPYIDATKYDNVDCHGEWTRCLSNCAPKKYFVMSQKKGSGTDCPYADGDTSPCAPGEGDCPPSPSPSPTPSP